MSVVTNRVSLATAIADRALEPLGRAAALGTVGKVDGEIVDRRALKLALFGSGTRDLEEPRQRALKCLRIFESDRRQHALAVILDRLLEVADQGDPVAKRSEDVILKAQRLAAVGTDQLLLDHVDHAGLELVDRRH